MHRAYCRRMKAQPNLLKIAACSTEARQADDLGNCVRARLTGRDIVGEVCRYKLLDLLLLRLLHR